MELVKNKVEYFPEKFEVFINVLKECFWLEDIVKLIHENYYELTKPQVLQTNIKVYSLYIMIIMSV